MAKTSYYTVDSEIVAERTTGVGRREYLPDALGSVTATIFGSGIQNTYFSKPYGSELSQSGAATEPSYIWNGMWGYRATGRPYAESYIRGRTYSSSIAKWASKDRFWPTEPPYGYARSAPTTLTDPTGNDAFYTIGWPDALYPGCQNSRFPWTVQLSTARWVNEPPRLYVQHVFHNGNQNLLTPTGLILTTTDPTSSHWELWPMDASNVGPQAVWYAQDSFSHCFPLSDSLQQLPAYGESHQWAYIWLVNPVLLGMQPNQICPPVPGCSSDGSMCTCPGNATIPGLPPNSSHTKDFKYIWDTTGTIYPYRQLFLMTLDGNTVKTEKHAPLTGTIS